MKIFLKIILLCLLPSLIAGQQVSPYLNNLLRSLSVATNDTARMEACSNLGSYYLLEDRDSASFYLEKALPIAVRLNLKLDEASILNKMGILLMQQEKFSKSLEFYLKAINIAKDPSTEKSIWRLSAGQRPRNARMLELSRSYDFIGLLNAYTGNWIDNIKKQLENYREAEKYANAAGDKGQIASVIFHMGISYMNAGKLDSALMFIKKAQSTFSDLKDPQIGRSMIYLGETYERMGNFDLAVNTMLQAMAFLNETNDNVHRGLGYISLSRVYATLKKTDSALYYAKESLKIFENRNDPAWKRDAYDLLASYFDHLGKTDSATMYLKLAKSLSDSLSVEERKNLLAFQDIVVDEQVRLEKLEKERIETRGKLRIYLLLSGIVVFIVIIFLLYRNNQHRKKTNETLRQRNEKIENTLHQLRSTQTQLIQSEKMASLGALTAGIAHEIQNPLNFVNNFSDVNEELLTEMKDELSKGKIDDAIALANDVIENQKKINHHGKRADAIVKGMLQHSRSSSGIKEPTDINALADEYLRLTYHGLRAKNKEFKADFNTDFDDSIGKINIVSQDIGRVLLNLINNAFYSVNEKKKSKDETYQPAVLVQTKNLNETVEIIVSDNGNGIPESIKEKIFQPFFTTKPTGQGTGLGLSLSYDIVKAHGGEIIVETKEGEGTEFIIQLPYV
ncbi:MAG: tetratricopeptide repeat-containing sensor histidine kinase [Chitinophagaceae bacterium]